MQEVGRVLQFEAQRAMQAGHSVSGLHERGAKHFVAVVVKCADLMKDDWRKMEGRRGGGGKEPLGQ